MINTPESNNQLPEYTKQQDLYIAPPVAEQSLATQALTSVVDETLQNRFESIEHYHTMGNFWRSFVLLETTVGQNNIYIEVVSNTLPEDRDYDPAWQALKEVYLMAGDDTSEEGANIVIYRAYADGSTRRWNTDMDKDFHTGSSKDDGAALLELFADRDDPSLQPAYRPLEEGVENVKFQREMGSNDQLVGLAEIEKLSKLLSGPAVSLYQGEPRTGLIPQRVKQMLAEGFVAQSPGLRADQ